MIMYIISIIFPFNIMFKRIEKIEQIRLLFINFHHMINEMRPHQALETLKLMLCRQITTIEDKIKEINEKNNETEELISRVKAKIHSI
ncbi:hypothetical protein MXB_4619, partial [Myxobolus squamalis]